MKSVELAWAAGLLDGEGAFTIKRHIRLNTSGQQKVYYQLWLACALSDRPHNVVAIEKLHDLFGGNYHHQTPKGQRLGVIAWCIVSQQGLKCLRLIKPYLVIKKQHTELLIEFQESVKRRGKRYDAQLLDYYEDLFHRLRELNTKNAIHLQRLNERTPD